MNHEDLRSLFWSHRSIRSYQDRPLDPALIEEVCADAIAGGASSGNLNSLSIILTRDPDRKARLYELHFEQKMILEAPLVMTFCADWCRTRDWLKLRQARDNFDHFLGFVIGAIDAIIVAQNVCLGFEGRGLGTCYMGTTLSRCTEIAAFLETPETCVPVTSIVVGYPAEDPAKRDRLPSAALLHEERYRRPEAAELLEVYREREVRGWERYMSIPELRERIEAHGIRSLAEFYTSDHKYPPAELREEARRLAELLAVKHFWP